MKNLINGIITCWKCQKGGNRESGPLIKIDRTNYAHKVCFDLYGKPGAMHQSLIPVKEPEEERERKNLAFMSVDQKI